MLKEDGTFPVGHGCGASFRPVVYMPQFLTFFPTKFEWRSLNRKSCTAESKTICPFFYRLNTKGTFIAKCCIQVKK